MYDIVNMSLIIITIYFVTILLSIIGIGFLSSKVLEIEINRSKIYLFGLIGIISLTFISYFTNLFIAHNFLHNILLLSIGLISLFFGIKKKNIDFFNLKKIIFLSVLLILLSLLYKTHDDFDWYHLPYILNIAQNKLQFGLGSFNLGFRTPSSLFYLNSLFYLPVIEFYSFNFAQLYIFLFGLIFFYTKIFYENNKNSFIFFYSLLSFIFIIIVFYRLAEHGTDRSGQLLVFLVVIFIIEILKAKKLNINLIYIILIFLVYIITIKTYFVIFGILFLPLLFKIKSNFKIYKQILLSKISIFCILFLILHFNIQVANTGCLFYPINFTCYSNFIWSINESQLISMQEHYELWAKSGMNPNFRIENSSEYIKNFNWVSRWFNEYFFNKVSDLLAGILTILLICYFILRNKSKKFLTENKINLWLVLFCLFVLLIIWFIKFPQLRYGGYAIIANLIFIPFCIYLINHSINRKIIFRAKILITISLLIFTYRNIDRIIYEINFYKFDPLSSAFYRVQNPEYKKKYLDDGIEVNITSGACWAIPQPCFRSEVIQATKKNNYIIYWRD